MADAARAAQPLFSMLQVPPQMPQTAAIFVSLFLNTGLAVPARS
jgi:hypothetical protein